MISLRSQIERYKYVLFCQIRKVQKHQMLGLELNFKLLNFIRFEESNEKLLLFSYSKPSYCTFQIIPTYNIISL